MLSEEREKNRELNNENNELRQKNKFLIVVCIISLIVSFVLLVMLIKKQNVIKRQNSHTQESQLKNPFKGKSILNDILIMIAVFGPILYIIIGYNMWENGKFNGTIMESIFPSTFFALCAAYLSLIFITRLCENNRVLWIIIPIICFGIAFILYFINQILLGLFGFVLLLLFFIILIFKN